MAADDHHQHQQDHVGHRAPAPVVVVDDNARYRAGIVRALGRRSDLDVVAEAEDGLTGLQTVRRLRPAVVVADVRMPGLDGLELTRALAADPGPAAVRVLLLSGRTDDDLLAAAIEAGAVGCVDKAAPRTAIADAVARAATGVPAGATAPLTAPATAPAPAAAPAAAPAQASAPAQAAASAPTGGPS